MLEVDVVLSHSIVVMKMMNTLNIMLRNTHRCTDQFPQLIVHFPSAELRSMHASTDVVEVVMYACMYARTRQLVIIEMCDCIIILCDCIIISVQSMHASERHTYTTSLSAWSCC